MAEPMLQAHYAHARGVEQSAIALAARRGLIRLDEKGRVADPDQADAVWYRRHLQRQDHRHSGAEGEARREQALIQSTSAKIIMLRRQSEKLRDATIARDQHQAEISAAAVEAWEQLVTDPALGDEIIEALAADLGDVQAEALRVTQ